MTYFGMNKSSSEIEAEMIYNVEPVDYSKFAISVVTNAWEQMQTPMTLKEDEIAPKIY
jgi:hypothetical protein